MEKIRAYDQTTMSLNVIRCSTFSPGFLNRQFIIALSDLGVSEKYFLEKMKRLRFLIGPTYDGRNIWAFAKNPHCFVCLTFIYELYNS